MPSVNRPKDYPEEFTNEYLWEHKIYARFSSTFNGIRNCFEVRAGWLPIVYEFLEGVATLKRKENFDLSIHQIKQKFAEMRIYYGVQHCSEETMKEIDILVEEANKTACVTCETCGAPAKRVSDGYWLAVLCDTCKVEEDTTRHNYTKKVDR